MKVRIYQSEKWLRFKYLRQKRTMQEMAKEAGCSEINIRRYLDKYGIKR